MIKSLLTASTLLPAFIFSANTFASDNDLSDNADASPWYQVEVVIFSRDDKDTSEQWPIDLHLSYSANRVQLVKPVLTESQSEETAAESSPITTGDTDTAIKAYKPLPAEQRELLRDAQAINRKKGYKVLFHESWKQPVFSAENAPSIAITGGDLFGEHHTLEGEIKLSVARYLHFSTNLWLSEFEMNYGQLEHREWQELPEPPFTNDKAIKEVSDLSDYDIPEFKLQLNETQNPTGEDHDLLHQTYLPSKTIHFKQHRRMRSKELHYIDHPRIGAIVKILPINTDQ